MQRAEKLRGTACRQNSGGINSTSSTARKITSLLAYCQVKFNHLHVLFVLASDELFKVFLLAEIKDVFAQQGNWFNQENGKYHLKKQLKQRFWLEYKV